MKTLILVGMFLLAMVGCGAQPTGDDASKKDPANKADPETKSTFGSIGVTRNGAVAGYFMGATSDGSAFFVEGVGIIAINMYTGKFLTESIYYNQAGCLGNGYLVGELVAIGRVAKTADGYAKVNTLSDSATITVASAKNAASVCLPAAFAWTVTVGVLSPIATPDDFSDLAPIQLELLE
jgi:hypothetical protein